MGNINLISVSMGHIDSFIETSITWTLKFELKFLGQDRGLIDGESRRNSLRLQESRPKSLAVEVVSSQSRVAVSVDGTTVSRLKDSGHIGWSNVTGSNFCAICSA
jgi:hypothetical protein